MTLLLICLAVVALIAFAVLMAALAAGASDPGFEAGSDDDSDGRFGDKTEFRLAH